MERSGFFKLGDYFTQGIAVQAAINNKELWT